MVFKVYMSVSKGLKLKVRQLLGVTPSFGKVTGKKLLGETFCPLPYNPEQGSQIADNSKHGSIMRRTDNLSVFSKTSLIQNHVHSLVKNQQATCLGVLKVIFGKDFIQKFPLNLYMRLDFSDLNVLEY